MSNMLQAIDWGNRTQSNQIPISYWSGFFQTATATGGNVTTRFLTQAEVQAFNTALNIYDALLNIDWFYAGDNVNTRMNLMVYDNQQNPDEFGAMGPPNSGPATGIGTFNGFGTGWDEQGGGGLNLGGQGLETIIHELGHSLGLKHPHDDGPGGCRAGCRGSAPRSRSC